MVKEISDRLAGLEADLEGAAPHQESIESRLVGIEAKLSALEGRSGRLEDAVSELRDRSVSTERFRSALDRQQSARASLRSRHDELHDRVHTEFDHIRTILTHLVEAQLDGEDGAVSNLEVTSAHTWPKKKLLASLTAAANQLDVREPRGSVATTRSTWPYSTAAGVRTARTCLPTCGPRPGGSAPSDRPSLRPRTTRVRSRDLAVALKDSMDAVHDRLAQGLTSTVHSATCGGPRTSSH